MKIGHIEYNIPKENIKSIESKIIENTCKTNLNPHLLFRVSYSEHTSRPFIGNWQKDGFWITKYREQFINFRADIIAKGSFKNIAEKSKLTFDFILGFSSLVGGMFIVLFIAIFLTSITVPPFISFSLPTVLYTVMTIIEVSRAKEAIEKYLL